MKHTTVVRSWSAIALGTLFAAGTMFVLCDDIWKGGPVTVDHVLSALVLTGVIYAGHAVIGAVRDWRVFATIGLAGLFLVGTGMLVIKSASRNAVVLESKVLAAQSANAERSRVLAELDAAKQHREQTASAAARECRTGVGRLCRGAQANATAAEAHVESLTQRLDAMAAPKVEREYRRTAETLQVMLGITASSEAIEKWLILALPFLQTLLLEIGTAVLFGYGLGHASREEPTTTRVSDNDNGQPPPQPTRPTDDAEVIDWVRAHRARHGRTPQIPDVQARFGLSKTTAWRRIRAAA